MDSEQAGVTRCSVHKPGGAACDARPKSCAWRMRYAQNGRSSIRFIPLRIQRHESYVLDKHNTLRVLTVLIHTVKTNEYLLYIDPGMETETLKRGDRGPRFLHKEKSATLKGVTPS